MACQLLGPDTAGIRWVYGVKSRTLLTDTEGKTGSQTQPAVLYIKHSRQALATHVPWPHSSHYHSQTSEKLEG